MSDLSIALLRSYLAYAETGSLAAAAQRLGRTESAVSLQLAKLESQTGLTLFDRSGRKLALTPQGDLLLGHARAILGRVDLALAELRQTQEEGSVRLGLVQDFAGDFLIETLKELARQRPGLRVDVVADRSTVLLQELGAERLDLAICAQAPGSAGSDRTEPMVWLGNEALCGQAVLPIALVTAPCPFRDAALVALERQGRAWRIAFETPSLEGLRSTIRAGLALGCRTRRFMADVPVLGQAQGLPDLPLAHWALRSRRNAGPKVQWVTQAIKARLG